MVCFVNLASHNIIFLPLVGHSWHPHVSGCFLDSIISSSTVMISSHGVLPLSTKPPSPAVGALSTDTMQPSQTSEISPKKTIKVFTLLPAGQHLQPTSIPNSPGMQKTDIIFDEVITFYSSYSTNYGIC